MLVLFSWQDVDGTHDTYEWNFYNAQSWLPIIFIIMFFL